MSSPEPAIQFLLANTHAEEIKLVSSSLRGFFPNCRIEAVYTSDDAITASQEGGWHVILVDQNLAPDSGVDIISRLRRNAPYAAVILQTDRSDSETAVRALQCGVDFLLFKNSPAFLTELLFYVQEAIEKRDLRTKLDETFQRHLRLVETLSDIFYELDREGRFVYLSPGVTGLLGYSTEELAGRHYSILCPSLQEPLARFRVNERRAGSRSIRQLEIPLQKKAHPGRPVDTIVAEVTAKGLYDSANRYLGTVGLIRDVSQQKEQQGRLLELESKLRESDRRLALSREAATVSDRLQQPLTGLLNDSQRLLATLQHLKIEQALETMAAHAIQASQLSRRLSSTMAHAAPSLAIDLNALISQTLQRLQDEQARSPLRITTHLHPSLPSILGNPESLETLLRVLISYAQRHVEAMTPLELRTDSIRLPPAAPYQGTTATDTAQAGDYVTLTIRDQPIIRPARATPSGMDTASAVEFVQAHQIVHRLGGAIEIDSTRQAGLLITLRIPAVDRLEPAPSPAPTTLSSPGTQDKPARTVEERKPELPADRRRFARRPVNFPVQVAIGSSGYPGLIRNISAGGALMALNDVDTSLHLQPAYLLLKTPVSLLELQGTVYERPSPASAAQQRTREIAISFTPPSDHDRRVIDSLLDGALAGSTTLSIEGLIPLPTLGPASDTSQRSEEATRERREAVRLKLAIPIRLNLPGEHAPRPLGLIVNLSRTGAAVEIQGRPDTITLRQPVQLVPIGPVAHTAGPFRSPTSELVWTGFVVWTQPIPASEATTSNRAGDLPVRLGIRFQHLSEQQEAVVQRLLIEGTSTPFDLAEPIADSAIITLSRTVRNRRGLSVALCHDVLRHLRATPRPSLVLAPGFGQTQTAYVALAYFLAARGIRVVRYDHTNHIGLSEGSHQQVTMSSMEDDLDAVLLWIRRQWPDSPVTLIAPDLVGRIAARRSDWHSSLRSLVLLNPALDLRSSLERLHHRDLVQDHINRNRFGIGNLMGLNIDIDRFLADAVGCNLTDFEPSRADLRRCRVETTIIRSSPETGGSPIPPLPEALVAEAMQAIGSQGHLETIPGLTLEAAETVPTSLREKWERFYQLCTPRSEFVEAGSSSPPPLGRAIAIRCRLERDKLRTTEATGGQPTVDLWTSFTRLTAVLDELPAFWQLTDQLYQLAQPIHEGARLLDVGCGVHSFARSLLLNLSYRLRSQAWRQSAPVRYVGVDFSCDVLRNARAAAQETLDRLDTMFSGCISSHPPVKPHWALSHSIESLPFATDSFDRVVANLAISFAPSPLHTLRELFRVLKPGGKLAFSSFWIGADPATLYRPHLQELGLDEFTGEARVTLSVMAHLCESLRTGRLQAFEEDSLADLVAHATRTIPTIQRAMTGHTLVATVEKPVSAG